MSNNIAVIPARGGSKRIPKKNIKMFAGQPMIAYSIKAAKASGCFDEIVVSTDDNDIADIAKRYGASVPFMRPGELSSDSAGTMPVIAHAISELEKNRQIDNVCLIYPTAPLICSVNIAEAYSLFMQSKATYTFSAVTYPSPIQRALKFDVESGVSMFYPEYINTRSQNLEEAYHDAAQFYWGKAQAFKYQLPVFAEHSNIFPISRWRAQDIDTEEDWQYAERLYHVQVGIEQAANKQTDR